LCGIKEGEKKEAAVDQWLRRWTLTQWMWLWFLLALILSHCGVRTGIWPELFTCTRKVPLCTWATGHVRIFVR